MNASQNSGTNKYKICLGSLVKEKGTQVQVNISRALLLSSSLSLKFEGFWNITWLICLLWHYRPTKSAHRLWLICIFVKVMFVIPWILLMYSLCIFHLGSQHMGTDNNRKWTVCGKIFRHLVVLCNTCNFILAVIF